MIESFRRRILPHSGNTGGIDLHPLAECSSQQLADRRIQRFAGDIPERDIDPAHRLQPESLRMSANAHRRIQPVPMQRVIGRILPDQQIGDQLPNDGGRHFRRHRRLGFPPTDDAGIGRDLDDRAIDGLRIRGPATPMWRIRRAVIGQSQSGRLALRFVISPRLVTPVDIARRHASMDRNSFD